MFQSKFATGAMIGAIALMASSAANAHEFIASQSPMAAKIGAEATLVLDSTHQAGIPEEAEELKHVAAKIMTAGNSSDIEIVINDNAPNLIGRFDVPETAAWISAHRAGVVWSQTPDGWKSGGATEHADAIASARYEKFAKLLTGGTGDKAFVTTPIGTKLEIVPLSDPRDTKIGDDAEFRVLLDGHPLTTSVLATYAGFTDTPNSWAYATETLATENGSGIAKVRISAPGLWVVRVSADLPDSEDGVGNHNLRATLSFAIDG